MKQYAALAGQIEQTLIDLTGVVNRINELLKQARQTSDKAYLEAAALYLHTCYEAVQQDLQNFKQFLLDVLPG